MEMDWQKIFPGVWNFQAGENDVTLTGFAGALPAAELRNGSEYPLPENVSCRRFNDSIVLRISLNESDRVFGGGLLFQRVMSDNAVYHLRADHFRYSDNGRSHAPVPFLAVTDGLGIFCNSPRPVSLYIRTAQRLEDQKQLVERSRADDPQWSCFNPPYYIEIAVRAKGAEFVLFKGRDLKDCTAKFNLFCGGGALPPKWGLGFWHRTRMEMDSRAVRAVVDEYRKHDLPLSVIGLEPGWQSGAYPCTWDWSEKRFADSKELIAELLQDDIRVNLWENGYISKKSSLHSQLLPFAGSHLVWGGIVPDYTLPEVRQIIRRHNEKTHLDIGVSGYKLDESDGLDIWLWPDHAEYPSGLDGFTMRNIYGTLFAATTFESFHEYDRRTWGLTRSVNGGGAYLPYVLYNDNYDFREFLTALVSSGFTGALWCPEVRGADNGNELLRRFQLLAVSPMLLLNAWATDTFVWSFPEVEAGIRQAIELRKSLMPYIYSAFAKYHFYGIPVYRPLAMDYGMFMDQQTIAQAELDDTENPYQMVSAEDVTDQFIFGETLMAAPLAPGETSRKVIFPPGKWYDFYTGEAVACASGVQVIEYGADAPLPLYAPDGAVIPMEKDGELVIRKFGDKPGSFELYEDDGETFAYERGEYSWRTLNA